MRLDKKQSNTKRWKETRITLRSWFPRGYDNDNSASMVKTAASSWLTYSCWMYSPPDRCLGPSSLTSRKKAKSYSYTCARFACAHCSSGPIDERCVFFIGASRLLLHPASPAAHIRAHAYGKPLTWQLRSLLPKKGGNRWQWSYGSYSTVLMKSKWNWMSRTVKSLKCAKGNYVSPVLLFVLSHKYFILSFHFSYIIFLF